jgi:hypothetical protein
MKAPLISMVKEATETETQDVQAAQIVAAVRSGRWENEIQRIRSLYASEFAMGRELGKSGDHERAKKAVKKLKKSLPAVTWSGKFSRRDGEHLLCHSGLLCADLDELTTQLHVKVAQRKLSASPCVWAVFLSPNRLRTQSDHQSACR